MRLTPGLALLMTTGFTFAEDPATVFDRRIKPIFNSPNPSSCVQCHLAGVDLKHYILPSAEDTFRSLRDQGLIDLTAPKKSKILALIEMGDGATDATAIQSQNRKAEYEAFSAWIAACIADERLRELPKFDEKKLARPSATEAVIRHARKDRLLESFEKNIWAIRFRCMNCHIEGTPQNDKLRAEHGDRVAWVKRDAAATMNYILSTSLIDPKSPDKSLLLRKPLNDSKHGGGIKFVVGDQGYKGFRQWIEDVAAIRTNRYSTEADLPKTTKTPLAFGTDIWLKLENTREAWADKLLQADVFAWDDKAKAWRGSPIASTDRRVWGKGKLWQHNLTLYAESGSDHAKAWSLATPTLPGGRYLIKVYVDKDDRLAKDWLAALGQSDFVGQFEVRSNWPSGYGKMTVADGRNVQR